MTLDAFDLKIDEPHAIFATNCAECGLRFVNGRCHCKRSKVGGLPTAELPSGIALNYLYRWRRLSPNKRRWLRYFSRCCQYRNGKDGGERYNKQATQHGSLPL